jgi:phage-related protein
MAAKGITLPIIFKADDKGIKDASSALQGFGKSLKGIGGLVAGAFTIGAISSFVKSAVLAAEEAKAVNDVLVQVAKNTIPVGTNIAVATDRMIKFADSQEVLLGIDGEIIKSTQAKLLGFTNLASSAGQVGGVFDRTLSASFDLAAATGKDVSAMSTALGKALEDPLSALGGLAKGQVKFSESQQEMIRGLVESGDLLGAQEVILGVVEGKFGGAAEAAAKGSERFANAMENLMETAGEPLLGVFADLVSGLQPVLTTVGTELANVFVELGPVLGDIVALIPGLLEAFLPLIPILGVLAGLFLEMVAQLLPVFVELFEQLLPVILELAPILADVFLQVLEALLPVFMEIIAALMPIVSALLPVLAKLIIALAPVIITLVQAFLPLIEKILPHVISLIEFLTPILVAIGEIIGVVLVAAVGFFIAAFENVQKFFEEFGPIFKNIFVGLQIVFATVINAMITGFENFINFFVRGFNTVLRGINAIRRELDQAEFALAAEVKFGRVEVPTLTPLAVGGIVTGPTAALIGEAGPEAVIPLDKLGKMGNTYNITVNAGIGTNGSQVGEQIVNAIRKYERTSGPVFARA